MEIAGLRTANCRAGSSKAETHNMLTKPPSGLKVGDLIRILRVSDADLKQRESEIARDVEMAGWTADTIERIISEHPVVTICQIDEYGYPWYEVSLIAVDGETEEHSLRVYDDRTWEKVTQ